MKANISALIDGELEDSEAAASLASLLERDAAAHEAWICYHLIGDVLNGTRALSRDFSERFAVRLATEPTVLAPVVAVRDRRRRRWVALSVAASMAAAVLVGWVAFAPQQNHVPAAHPFARIAQAHQASVPVAQTRALAVVRKVALPRRVPLPREADDYLLAHQSYSLQSSLQAMMPYVHTVAIENGTGKP